MALLRITPVGYRKIIDAEPYGFLAKIMYFRVEKQSMQGEPGAVWGYEVYMGRISDYTIINRTTILYTCIVPESVDSADIDSIHLLLESATGSTVIFAQGFLDASITHEKSSRTTIYAYINLVYTEETLPIYLPIQASIPQVENYCDLPAPENAMTFEYVVNNGHCGRQSRYPEYFPTLVVLSSPPDRTLLYPTSYPLLDADTGTLTEGTYTYAVTSTNSDGESIASPLSSITLQQLSAPTTYIELSSGNVEDGDHEYVVTALSPGGGETLPSASVTITVDALLVPEISAIIDEPGGLPIGTYEYSISAFNDFGETIPGSTVQIEFVADDRRADISWSAVDGAVGYYVWGREVDNPILLGVVDAAYTDYTDWGAAGNISRIPVTATTANGVRVLWDHVVGADGYRIYGRDSGSTLYLLDEVASDRSFWDDVGVEPSVEEVPVANTTSSGVLLIWNPVQDATGYQVYGRVDGSLGLIGTLGNVLEWVDDGSVSPTGTLPVTNTSGTNLEWQILDGTPVYRGDVVSATDSTVTVDYSIEKKDFGCIQILDGTGAGQSRHIKHVGNGVYLLLDKLWDIAPNDTSSMVLWASSGCCGGVCEFDRQDDPTPRTLILPSPPPPPVIEVLPPDFLHLGVHMSGNFLGSTVAGDVSNSSVLSRWNKAANGQQSNLIEVGSLDPAFCNEDGVQDLTTKLESVMITPHGNRFPTGDYASLAKSASRSIKYTIDSLAIPDGYRVIIYEEENFQGDILLDINGPFYIGNYIWKSDDRYAWAIDSSVWASPLTNVIAQANRAWSKLDMHTFKTGSMRIVEIW